MVQAYSKPHLTFADQLAQLKQRGIECADDASALNVLHAAGYYRLSAYVYPFRGLLADGDARSSPAHHRSELIRDGTSFEQIEQLWRFDRKLRLTCLDGLETVEIGVRTQLAYVLGARDVFGHLERAHLDSEACSQPSRARSAPSGEDEFDVWVGRYAKLQSGARTEDFVRHNILKYGDRLPIWIAVEFLDFGAVVRLFGLLERADQNSIARALDVSDGRLLYKWLRVLNYLRNTAAHHSRLWNRTLTYKPGGFPANLVPPRLAHIATLEPRGKVYVSLALTAHLVRQIDPRSNWPSTLRTVVRKFPAIDGIKPETHMGFPENWHDLELWRHRSNCTTPPAI